MKPPCPTQVADFAEPFDVGMTLHACGGATEDVLESCVRNRAAFCVVPCCVGGVQNWTNGTYPRSRTLARVVDGPTYMELAKAADTNASTRDLKGNPPKDLVRRRLCKSVVETDRLERAREAGYDGFLALMAPLECTPKNDMIVAWPRERHDLAAKVGRTTPCPEAVWLPPPRAASEAEAPDGPLDGPTTPREGTGRAS